ncbi:plant cysteine oxidase 1-like isoform X2 [Momordica charantia]|nr:plant cysteine oxidase 1-like isoform X2 [Momordica charantia]
MALQELFLSCREVFKGPGTIPLPSEVDKISRILDNMKAEDVGLCSSLQFFKPNVPVKGSPRVTYTTIYKCANFSLCIFFLPATGVIPLHNHPGMTVFSKLLLGKMHIKSYDWADQTTNTDDSAPPCKKRLAKLKADDVFTSPCSTSVLYPTTGGNIHSFTAITPCAVLDVLGPPYSMEDGRDCSYYKEHPYASFPNGEMALTKEEEGESYGWLEEIEMPENSHMDGIEYLGPQIIEI